MSRGMPSSGGIRAISLRSTDASCRSALDIMVFPQRVPRLVVPEHLGSESMPRIIRGSQSLLEGRVLDDEIVVVE